MGGGGGGGGSSDLVEILRVTSANIIQVIQYQVHHPRWKIFQPKKQNTSSDKQNTKYILISNTKKQILHPEY